MSGSNDSNAHPSIDKTASHRVWLLPFVSELQSKSFLQLLCFPSGQSVSGDNKRREVLMLCKTGIKILLLFLFFLPSKNLVRVLE
jgi:hypothetical protein